MCVGRLVVYSDLICFWCWMFGVFTKTLLAFQVDGMLPHPQPHCFSTGPYLLIQLPTGHNSSKPDPCPNVISARNVLL